MSTPHRNPLTGIEIRDIVLGIVYLKPGRNPCFVEEALAHGLREVFHENPQYQQLFDGQNSEGSCGSTHTGLDDLIEGLYFIHLRYSNNWQFSSLTSFGKEYVKKKMGQKYGTDILPTLQPLAGQVWEQARQYPGMYNRPSLYQ